MDRIEIVTKDLPNSPSGAVRWLLRDTRTGQHYIASGVNAMITGWEVLVFEADDKGEVTSWGDVAGGRGISHQDAAADLEEQLAGDAP